MSIDTLVVDLGDVAATFHPERRLAALAESTGYSPTYVHETCATHPSRQQCQ